MHTLATSAAAFGGTDVRAAARIALGETPELPVLPALADRGIGDAHYVHERAGESLLRWVERDLLR